MRTSIIVSCAVIALSSGCSTQKSPSKELSEQVLKQPEAVAQEQVLKQPEAVAPPVASTASAASTVANPTNIRPDGNPDNRNSYHSWGWVDPATLKPESKAADTGDAESLSLAPIKNGTGKIQIRRWQQAFDVPAASQMLWINNPFGSVVLRSVATSQITVVAIEQSSPKFIAAALQSANRRNQYVSVGFFDDQGESITPAGAAQVDLVVYVPTQNPLVVQTRDGALSAQGLNNTARLESTTGTISASSSKPLQIACLSCTVDYSPSCESLPDSNISLTDAGSIDLQLPVTCPAGVAIDASSIDVSGKTLSSYRAEGSANLPGLIVTAMKSAVHVTTQ